MRSSLVSLFLVSGCAHPAPAYPASTARLESLVPVGAETLVVLELAQMRSAPELSGTVDAVLGLDDRQILEAWLRVPLASVDRLVVAVFPEGYVVLVEGAAIDARRVVRDAGVRMGQIEISDERPFLRRAGRLGVERRELVALSPTRFAIGGEHGAGMIALLEAARGVVPGALDSAEGLALRDRLGESAVLVVALAPLTLPSESEVAVLLARHRMLGAAIAPTTDPGWVSVRVGIVGELPPGADENLRLLAESLVSSAAGGLFGMREGDGALVVSTSEEGATIVHRIASASLAIGLREVFLAEIGEIGRGVPSPR